MDDAIVMLENIYRHMEMGKSRMQAAFDGAKEIGFAIVATTIALVAIFIPVAFLTGNVGRLFNEFGMTVAVSVLISGFVALSLTPMLSSRMLRSHQTEGKLASAVQRRFDALDNFYDRTVRRALLRRKLILAVTAATIIAIVWLFRSLPSELVPTEDRGTIVGVLIAPEGSTLAYTDRYARQIEEIFTAVPERGGLFTAIGLTGEGPGRVTDGFFFLPLKGFEERERSQQEIVQELFPKLLAVPGVLAFAINPPSLGGQFSSTPVQYVIQAPTYDELRPAVEAMMAEAAKLPYLLNLDTDLKLNTPQIELSIDRARASSLGVSVTDIGTTLQTLLGGRESTQFRRGDKQYKVLLQVRPSERATPRAIEDLYLRGTGGLFQMTNVVTARETVAPKELNHFNRVRSAQITANLVPGVTLGKALDDLDAIARAKLPTGVRTDLDGESRELRESGGSLAFLFGISVVFIYLVLAAQFESFIASPHDPAHGAARDLRRAPDIEAPRDVFERLLPDRAHPPDRARDEERDPDRRVREPAPPQGGPRAPRGGGAIGPRPAAPDPDDLAGDDLRRSADRARPRRRRREPQATRRRCRRRDGLLDAPDSRRRAGRLHVPGGSRSGGGSRRGTRPGSARRRGSLNPGPPSHNRRR